MNDPIRHDRPSYVRRALFAELIGGVLLFAVQYYAPSTDYQYAFMAAAAVVLVTAVFVLYFLQRASHRAGHPYRVPVLAAVGVVLLVLVVRVETFSGEMVPQLTWRFASHVVPELQTPTPETDQQSAPSGIPAPDSADEPTPEDRAANYDVTFGQFLGNNRTGVLPDRDFAIPESADEIKTLWNIGIGGGWSSFAIAVLPGSDPDRDGIAVTLEQREERECVTAYDLRTGEMRWLVDHDALHFNALGEGGPRSTPTIEGSLVYAQGATGTVWCLDLLTGDEVWRVDLLDLAGWDQAESERSITWGRSGSPLIVDGLCVLPLGGNDTMTERSLIALDKQNGETVWTAGADQISYASPQLLNFDGVRQIVSVNESTITGHAIDDGAMLWKTDWPGQSNGGANCAAVIPAGSNRFLVGKGYGGGSALIEVNHESESWTAKDVWRSSRVLKTKFNHSVIRGDVAYGLSNGALQAVEVETGDRLWEQGRRGRYGQGQLLLVGDTLIVQSEMGDVALVAADPNRFNELIRLDALHQKTWNVPSLSGNRLLVRNAEEAIAFELPKK